MLASRLREVNDASLEVERGNGCQPQYIIYETQYNYSFKRCSYSQNLIKKYVTPDKSVLLQALFL